MDLNGGGSTGGNLFLIFHQDDQIYGVPVANVREIIPMVEITPVPDAPPVVQGVINLRGTIVPILDLRRKLKLQEKQADARTCIVVTEVPELTFGFLADRVTDCLEIDEISRPDKSVTPLAADRKLIHGIGQCSGQIVILLSLENLVSAAEKKVLKTI